MYTHTHTHAPHTHTHTHTHTHMLYTAHTCTGGKVRVMTGVKVVKFNMMG